MPRLTSPTGVTVNVSDEKAAQLASVGYSTAEKSTEAKADSSTTEAAPRKRTAKKKS